MEAKFQKVLPENFDVNVLYKAAQEGSLFLSVEEMASDKLKEEILNYVVRIENYVSRSNLKAHYTTLWTDIICHPLFGIDSFRYKKGARKGKANTRMVFIIVRHLKEHCKIYSESSAFLARVLEGTKNKPSIYTSSSNNRSYNLTMQQMLVLDRIVERYKKIDYGS